MSLLRLPGRRALIPLLVIGVCAGVTVLSFPGGRGALVEAVTWLRQAGALGQAVAVVVTVVGISLGLPTTWFGALLGYLYGFAALAISMPATVVGSLMAFAIGRWVLRGDVSRLVHGRPRWRAIHDSVGGGGLRLVILLRLWAPHNVLNLVLGGSSMSTRVFLVGSTIGLLPTVLAVTVGGALAPEAVALWDARRTLGPTWIAVAVAGGLALVAALVLIQRGAQRAFARAVQEAERSARRAATAPDAAGGSD